MHLMVLIAFAQRDFRAGYIIRAGGDTTECYINYRVGTKDHRICQVRNAPDEDVRQLNAMDIEGYGFVNDKFFESRIVDAKGKVAEPVFVEVIVKGQISLYRYGSAFFVNRDTSFIQLTNEKKEINVDGRRMIREDKKYIQVLSILMRDCTVKDSDIMNTKLSEKSLSGLIESYHQCIGGSYITYKASKPWFKADCGIGVSANISKIKFETNISNFGFFSGDFPPDFSVSPVFYMNAYSPRINERMAFHCGFYYLRSEYRATIVQQGAQATLRNDVFIEQHEIKFPVGIRYQFRERKFKPYINMGISINVPLGSNAGRVLEWEFNHTIQTSEQTSIPIPESTFGMWGGFGLDLTVQKKANLFVEARYEWSKGHINEFPYPSNGFISNTNGGRFLIGWRF